jgi:hypothetical protein
LFDYQPHRRSVQLEYEETLPAQHFSEYAAYRNRTRRLIPFVYATTTTNPLVYQ